MNPPDSPPSLETIKDALFELSELPEADRARRLAELNEQSPALVQALQSLLPGAMATVRGVQAPAQWLQALDNAGLPARLGPWRVVREIGRGGMGVVLLGERADGAFERQVAIKVLPPVLAAEDGARRLASEAQVLARLDHAHIARLLDAGVDQGCAYLVMEHVDGRPITDYAAARGLAVRQRLALMLQLCAAVQFAHGRLLVHRDIKPGNVLVDRSGQVRLLDFGIAKVLRGDAATATAQTAFTPAYASPEQLLGEPASVAGDVFSLGVLLYELLAGRHPFLMAGARGEGGTAEALAIVRSVIESPADIAALHRAGIPPDLQAVTLKALEKSVAQRYGSAEGLAVDIQAFLDGMPVKAQVPNWRYRATKFVQRHRWPVAASVATATVVLGLTAWAVHSANQAREQQALAQARLDAVRGIANKVVFDYNRALEPLPGTLEVRKTLVADALSYLDAMATDAKGDRALQADIAAGYEAVGDVQGRGVTGGNLGDLPAAERSYLRAAALRQPLCETAGVHGEKVATEACSAWATTLVRLGDNAFTQRRTEQAIAHFEQARLAAKRALDMPLPAADPGRQAALDARSQANQRLAGLSLRQTGAAYDRGLELAHDQLHAAQALAQELPGPKSQESLRVAHDFLAVRLLNEGQPELALPHIETAVRLARDQRAHRSPRDAGVALALSLVRNAEIQAHRLEPGVAAPLLDEALGLVKSLHLAEPEDRHLRGRYANVAWRVGEVNHLLGTSAALQANAALLPPALAAADLFTPDDGVFFLQRQRLHQELAVTALRQGQADQALKRLAVFPASMPPNPAAAADLADVFVLRAQALRELGRHQEALQAFRTGHAALKAAAEKTPGHVQGACRLMQAQLWASAWASAMSGTSVQAGVGERLPAPELAALAALAAPAVQGRDALKSAGKLSPLWARLLGAALP
jgi:tetratricopeptide (TPR) repeat protein